MSTVAPAPDVLARETEPQPHESKWWLFGPPAVALLIAGLVTAWILAADLDDIERRSLNWGNIWRRTLEHVELTAVATVIVLAIALPLGILLTRQRTKALAPVVIGVANVGQAAPALGLLVLLVLWLGLGFWPTIAALSLYGLLPVLRNTIAGLQQVDPALIEAGRGMGMSARAVLWRIELPLAVPVILAGVRLTLVLLVGTATLATFVDAGGLGVFITTGIALQRTSVLVVGALLVAALALLIDWLGRLFEEAAKPRGI